MDPYLRDTLELGLRYEAAALDFWRTLDIDDPAGRDAEPGHAR